MQGALKNTLLGLLITLSGLATLSFFSTTEMGVIDSILALMLSASVEGGRFLSRTTLAEQQGFKRLMQGVIYVALAVLSTLICFASLQPKEHHMAANQHIQQHQQSIQHLRRAQEQDMRHGYRTRAIALEAQIFEHMQQVQSLSAEASFSAAYFYVPAKHLATALNVNAETVLVVFNLSLAILLEVLIAWLAGLRVEASPYSRPRKSSPIPQACFKDVSNIKPFRPEKGFSVSSQSIKVSFQAQEAQEAQAQSNGKAFEGKGRQNVLAGKTKGDVMCLRAHIKKTSAQAQNPMCLKRLTNIIRAQIVSNQKVPAIRCLTKQHHCGHGKIRTILKQLICEGIIVKTNNGYHYVFIKEAA